MKIYAIVASEVRETGMVSFKFMFDSHAPYREFADLAGRYGLLTLKEKPDDFLDLFKIGRPEQEEALIDSDEPVMRWNLFVFESGRGQVLGGGVDRDSNNEGLTKLIGETGDFVLLTHAEALEGLKAACENLNIELTVFVFDGTLSTS